MKERMSWGEIFFTAGSGLCMLIIMRMDFNIFNWSGWWIIAEIPIKFIGFVFIGIFYNVAITLIVEAFSGINATRFELYRMAFFIAIFILAITTFFGYIRIYDRDNHISQLKLIIEKKGDLFLKEDLEKVEEKYKPKPWFDYDE